MRISLLITTLGAAMFVTAAPVATGMKEPSNGVTPQQTEVNEVEPTGCSVDLGLSNGCKPEEKAAVEDAIAKRQSCEITLKYSYCNTKVAAEEATPEIEN